MNKERYEEYLKEPHWQQVRDERLKIDKYRCAMCGSSGTTVNPLEVHHLLYKSIGKENVYKDVVTLCRADHQAVHVMMNRITSPEGRRGWKDQLPWTAHVFEDSNQEINYKRLEKEVSQ